LVYFSEPIPEMGFANAVYKQQSQFPLSGYEEKYCFGDIILLIP
jgi:hypothetical protein